MTFQLHSNRRISIESIGDEGEPLIVVDDFFEAPDTLIQCALNDGRVSAAAGLYPGLRSPAPSGYKAAIVDGLGDLIGTTFKLQATDIAVCDSYYSMVATPYNALHYAQQIPHFDQPSRTEIAILHYLCSSSHGGTSFYRHKNTGFEYVDTDRVQRYFTQLNEDITTIGLPVPPRYINGDTGIFTRIHSQDCVYNRALIYRCSSLHSGNIPEDYLFDLNPKTGRFTVATFLHT